jgi:uncharacterized protein YndB with AHSA1/START domain
VRAAKKPARLAFDLSVLGLEREPLFTGQYDVRLDAAPEGTRLRVELRLGRTTVAAVPAIAGIQQGWQQTLDQLAAAVGAARRTRSTPRRRTHRKEDR